MPRMPDKQPSSPPGPKRGVLARPLDALVFLLPLLIFYECASLACPERVIAFDLLRKFFELFGEAGMWAPGLGVVVILFATHAASRERWAVRWKAVGLMYPEAVVMSLPLLALNWAIPLSTPDGGNGAVLSELAFGIGAGVYEELVFRLILISVVVMIGTDLLGLGRTGTAVVAIVVSSVLFAAHHHPPVGMDPFNWTRFAFRTVAGGYLALVFWYRGYGSAAGCHAAYNVGLLAVDALGG